MAKVVLKNIVKRFQDNEVLKKINLEIKDQEFMVLVGPSGCGKTTTLRIVAGLEESSDGEVYIGDQDVTNVLPKDRDIAMVFQSYALYPHLNVFDNMAFGLKLRKVAKKEIKDRVHEASEILNITELLKRKPRQLSGGQRQRVALGRAIVRKPAVFLMDEPLSNLDAKLRVQMRGELKKLHNTLKTTVIYVTHDQVEAMTLGTRVVVMNQGYIQQIDAPIEVYDNPANMFVAGFIGSPAMNFFTGIVDLTHDKKYIFQTSGFQLYLPENLSSEFDKIKGNECILGIRPEDILDKKSAEYLNKNFNLHKATVDFSEVLGSENYLHMKLGENNFIAKVDPHINPLPGEFIEVAFDLRKMHIFDKETKNLII
ncbi:MAG: sn-glycerol-3-phosphate ABC transporter ATP-binding protein UgpC [Candidatus Margulisiibacteriota bacterium]|jgi:multiple sugar transport system ATP-binding protein